MPRGGRRQGAGRPRTRPVQSRAIARVPRPVMSKAIGSKIHYFKRTAYYSGFVTGSTVIDTLGSLIFQLQNVPNSGEFTALFDQYKINGVKVVFMPRANSSEVGTNQGLIKFFSAIDYDDNTAPTSINDLLQYENMKCTNTSKDHKRYLRPKIAREIYNSVTTTAYGPTSGWIDCTNAAVPHYGIKYALQQLPSGAQSMDIKVTYYLAFKNVR